MEQVQRYYPKYRLPVEGDLTADEAGVLVESQSEPHELIEVTDVCATHGICADLYDAAGALAGRVGADGSYRLGAP